MKNKFKIALTLLCCVIMVAVLFAACTPNMINVTFDPNYEKATLLPQSGRAGSSFDAPKVTRSGYELEGWYKSKDCSGSPQTFPVKLITDTTFYAKWKQITPEPEITLSSISVLYSGGTLLVGAELDQSKVSVTATYSDNSSKAVTGYSLSATSFTEAGVQTVTVTYVEEGVTKTATFTVNVVEPVVLTGITAVYNGANLYVGGALTKSNITVTAQYSDSSSKVVTGFSLSATTFTSAGEQTVTVTYTEGGVTKTTTFTVNVIAVVLDHIEAVYSGGKVALGQQPNASKLTVTAYYNNNTSKVVTNFSTGTVDSSTEGVKDWEISYTDNGVTESVTVKVTVADIKEPLEGQYDVNVIKNENLSIHFLELGNKYTGDSVYIKAGDTDILIDAGSRYDSAATITNYVDKFCTDGILEYVIATHAHQDHIAGFYGNGRDTGIFDHYECKNIIQFARTNATTVVYRNYLAKRDAEVANGANLYTALDCVNNANGAQKVYDLTGDGSITMEILYQEYYTSNTSNENNYSVCLMISQGSNHYLFTGDLEGEGEESLVRSNPNLPEMELWKGGHHGSYTAASTSLMAKIQPKCVCICSCMGTPEYNASPNHVFPAQEFCDRVAPYTDRVYITTYIVDYSAGNYRSANGNIVFACTNGQITMYFTGNNLKLKDTDWFKQYRQCPSAWAN